MYRRLRASGDGIVAASFTSLPVAPAEGEAMVAVSPNGTVSISDQAKAAELPENVMASGAMQTVRPTECPPCPKPSVIYRDRVITKITPGPTRYVYVTPGASDLVASSPSQSLIPRLPGGGVAPAPSAGQTPEHGAPYGGAAAGSPAIRDTQGRFPWWLLLVGAGAWAVMKGTG